VNDEENFEQPDREHTQPIGPGAPEPTLAPESGMTPPYAGPAYPQPQTPTSGTFAPGSSATSGDTSRFEQPYGPPPQVYGAAAGTYPMAGPMAGPTGHPAPHQKPPRGRVSGWIWPAVASLALVLGVIGGAVGGVAVQSWRDSHDDGRSSNGINGVDTVSVPPISAGNQSVAAVAKQLLPSTVQIMADYNGQHLGATGSGWVFDRQGHIITNNHVIASAADGGDIEVVDHSGHQYKAKLIGRSTVYDIAVLYVPQAKKLEPVSLGSSKAMNVGDPVVAIGSPLGLNETVTSGIVSALNRPVTTGESQDDTSYINAIQTDAAINPGNSGGPLVSMQGQVIGVNSAIATTGGSTFGGGESGNIGVGFAIPIEQVITTADQILRTGKAQYPVIGAQVLTGDNQGVDGAVIDSVLPDSPAAKAGLEKGDVITAVDDQKISDGQSLIVQIRTHQPGDTITLTLERDGNEKQVDLTLAGQDG
jgi:putative serine protease PepD